MRRRPSSNRGVFLNLELVNFKEFDKLMEAFPREWQNRALRKAYTAGGQYAKTVLRSTLNATFAGSPYSFGTYARSLAVKVKTNRKANRTYMRCGANYHYLEMQPKRRGKTKLHRRRPGKYAHFVENGTRNNVPAQRPVRRTLQAYGTSIALKIQSKLYGATADEYRRLARKYMKARAGKR